MTLEQEPTDVGKEATSAPTPSRQNESKGLSSLAGLVTAGLAVIGAVWFGLLSWASTAAYEPAGVKPREVGLGSGTVLTQSAIGLAVLVVISFAIQIPIFMRYRHNVELSGDRISWLRWLAWTGIAVFTVAVLNIAWEALDARSAIQHGVRTDHHWAPGFKNPWGGEIAELVWAGTPPVNAPKVPACALYLGEADGTVVIYDAAAQHTWRLPSSALIVIANHDKKKC